MMAATTAGASSTTATVNVETSFPTLEEIVQDLSATGRDDPVLRGIPEKLAKAYGEGLQSSTGEQESELAEKDADSFVRCEQFVSSLAELSEGRERLSKLEEDLDRLSASLGRTLRQVEASQRC